MRNFVDIKEFREECYEISIDDLRRSCPLYKVGKDMWIVGNEHLSFGTDVEFTRKVGKLLAGKIHRFDVDSILAVEAKSLGIAYEVAQNLGHKNFAIARKSIKPYNKRFISAKIESVTSAKNEALYLDEINIDRVKGKNIVLLDDVISTGSTMEGLLELARKAGSQVSVMASVWLEGPWPFERFAKYFYSDKLVYIDILPVFAQGEVYVKLYEKKVLVENMLKANFKTAKATKVAER